MVGLVSHVTRCLGLHFRAGSTIGCKVCAQFVETDLQNILRFIVTLSCVYRKIDFDIDLQRTTKCNLQYKHYLHTIPYSFNNVADIRNLQQYCSVEHYQSGRTKVKKT